MGKKSAAASTAVPVQVKRVKKARENAFLYDWKRNKNLLLMSLIGFIVVFIFNYLPMFGIVIAFKNYNLYAGIWASKWVGLRHFKSFFGDPYFFRLIRNTFLTGLFTFLFTFPAPIILALMLNELKDGMYKKTTQTITYLPYFISTVVVVSLLKTLLAGTGPVNQLLGNFGIEPILFFNEPGWFRTIYVVSSVWQTVGYNSIIYLAALSGVDVSLYEAATLDGATKMQKILHVTIPAISGTILVLLIMNVGSIVSVGFEKIYLMYTPATYETADVLSTYTYRRGMQNREFSYGAAVDLFNSVISMALLIIANTISKKVAHQGLW